MSKPNTSVWLIRYEAQDESHLVVHGHNALGDYRGIDEAASVTEIDVAGVPELLAAIRAYRTELKKPYTMNGQPFREAMERLDAAIKHVECTA